MPEVKFKVGTDPVTRVVRIGCSGFWLHDEAKLYLGQIADEVGAARVHGKNVRALVDNRNAAVQTFGIIGEVSNMLAEVYKPADRMAILVESVLLKRQMERLPTVAITRVFVTLKEAEDWLMSDSPA